MTAIAIWIVVVGAGFALDHISGLAAAAGAALAWWGGRAVIAPRKIPLLPFIAAAVAQACWIVADAATGSAPDWTGMIDMPDAQQLVGQVTMGAAVIEAAFNVGAVLWFLRKPTRWLGATLFLGYLIEAAFDLMSPPEDAAAVGPYALQAILYAVILIGLPLGQARYRRRVAIVSTAEAEQLHGEAR